MQEFKLSEGTAARRRFYLHLVDATDGITPETGEAAGQPQISKNGAAFANTSATLTSVGNGAYYVELTAAELDTLGKILVRYKSAATAEFQDLAQVVAYDPYDAVRAGLSALPNAAAEAAGGLFTRGSGAGQINQDANGRIDSRAVAMANNVITAAAIATGAIDADAIASDVADKLLRVKAGTTGVGSTDTTIISANLTESQTDYWKGMFIQMTSGACNGVIRPIAAFNPTTDEITVSPAFPTTVGPAESFVILRPGWVDVDLGTQLFSAINDVPLGAALQVWNMVLEAGFTADRILRIIAAAVAGKVSGGPASPVFRNLGDTQDQVAGTADADGNRTPSSYGP